MLSTFAMRALGASHHELSRRPTSRRTLVDHFNAVVRRVLDFDGAT